MKAQLICDQELINKYLNGEHSALELLISKHKRKIFSYILITVKDKQLAEDIFQDTFVKVINTLKGGTYNEEGKFLPWVMRIAHNLCIDFFRSRTKMPTINGSDDYDIFETINISDDCVEKKIITEQIHKDVKNLIELLPDEQKEVLIMRHYSDMSFKDIAEKTNVSINTALGRMRYAIINLRRLIKEKEIILTI